MYLFTDRNGKITNRQLSFMNYASAIAFFEEEVKNYFLRKKSFLNAYNYREYLDDLVETNDAEYFVTNSYAHFRNYGTDYELVELPKPKLYTLTLHKYPNDRILYTESVIEGSEVFFNDVSSYNGDFVYVVASIVAVRARDASEIALSDFECFERWKQEKISVITEMDDIDEFTKERLINGLPDYNLHAEGIVDGKHLDVFIRLPFEKSDFTLKGYEIIKE